MVGFLSGEIELELAGNSLLTVGDEVEMLLATPMSECGLELCHCCLATWFHRPRCLHAAQL